MTHFKCFTVMCSLVNYRSKKKLVANDFDGLTFIDVDNLWTERPVD